MSFFKVSAPPPDANFTFGSDSDENNNTDEDITATRKANRSPSPPRDLFSHSSSFLAVQAERIAREKKRKEREERRKREKSEERRRGNAGRKKEDGHEDGQESVKVEKSKGDSKRRRISAKDGEALLKKALKGTQVVELDSEGEDGDGNGLVMQPEDVERAPVRRSPRRAKMGGQYGVGAISRPKFPLPDQNDQDDDDEELQVTATKSIRRRPSPPPSDEDSDPEIAALSRQARAAAAERRRIQAEEEEGKPSRTSSTPLSDLPTTSNDPNPCNDPVISILITSPLPSTDAMIIRRKVSQTLGAVREAYCRRWNIPNPGGVFLTFCGRRLYDSTKCLRLGLVVEEGSGRVRWKEGRAPQVAADDGNGGEEEEDGEVKVHVEAVDEEWFRRIREEREKERREKFLGSGGGGDDEVQDVEGLGSGEGQHQQEALEKPKVKEWRLLVKAKGKKDFKVRVTADTLFSKILTAAKRSFGFPEATDAWMEFDGEKLDPQECVGQSEVEDLDGLELYVGR